MQKEDIVTFNFAWNKEHSLLSRKCHAYQSSLFIQRCHLSLRCYVVTNVMTEKMLILKENLHHNKTKLSLLLNHMPFDCYLWYYIPFATGKFPNSLPIILYPGTGKERERQYYFQVTSVNIRENIIATENSYTCIC